MRSMDIRIAPKGLAGVASLYAATNSPAVVGSTGSVVASSPSGSSSSPSLFTPEQWKALTGLFGNTTVPAHQLNGEFDNNLWIIDTGASHHVTREKSWLLDVQKINCPVGLPNGTCVLSTLVGSVCLSSQITLKNVLFVPNLSCNLLSVSQLSDDLPCDVQFNSSLCVI